MVMMVVVVMVVVIIDDVGGGDVDFGGAGDCGGGDGGVDGAGGNDGSSGGANGGSGSSHVGGGSSDGGRSGDSVADMGFRSLLIAESPNPSKEGLPQSSATQEVQGFLFPSLALFSVFIPSRIM